MKGIFFGIIEAYGIWLNIITYLICLENIDSTLLLSWRQVATPSRNLLRKFFCGGADFLYHLIPPRGRSGGDVRDEFRIT
jgi:hypothetical protein